MLQYRSTTLADPGTEFHIRAGDSGLFNLASGQSLQCLQSSVQLEWEQSGVPFTALLHSGDAPFEIQNQQSSLWLRIAVKGVRPAVLVQRKQDQASLYDLLTGCLERALQLSHMGSFTKRNSRTG